MNLQQVGKATEKRWCANNSVYFPINLTNALLDINGNTTEVEVCDVEGVVKCGSVVK